MYKEKRICDYLVDLLHVSMCILRDRHVDYVSTLSRTVYDRAWFIINADALPGAIASGFRSADCLKTFEGESYFHARGYFHTRRFRPRCS